MKYECPVCGGKLLHTRVDDGYTKRLIASDGMFENAGEKSNGYDEVICIKDSDHDIPSDLIDAVLNLC